MKLRIIDYSWGINRRTGERNESEAANVVFENLEVGPLPPIGRQVFRIEKVLEDGVILFLSPRSGSVEIRKDKPYLYRPLSMDGGHFYKISIE